MDNVVERDDEIKIDLMRLIGALIHKAWLIAVVSVVCALVTLGGTLLFVTPQYRSSAMFYVNNNSMSLGDAALSITSGDISASRGLVKSYIVILKSRETLNSVIDYAKVDRTYAQLNRMISAEAVDATEIFQVDVTGPDAKEAAAIADAVAYILPKRISSIIEGTSARIVDSAVVATKPVSPNYVKNTLAGFVLGFAMSVGAVALWVFMDTTIRTEEDITQNCKYPVLSAVPDMDAPSKSSYDRTAAAPGRRTSMVGPGLSFDAAEAYKLLRTKLQFSFADDNTSRVIGVSSALSGEGKSVSAINLAYSLSQLGMKVILIDGDLRRPTLAEKLNIQKRPGLSDFLTGQSPLDKTIRYCGLKGAETAFHVMTAGPNPPNPVELLSSARMTKLIGGMRDIFDYVIIDLPPVYEVSDALAVAKNTDGILMVVRQAHCNRMVMNETVRQFEFVGAKILGVVYNCATEGTDPYTKSYYKKYYHTYHPKTGKVNRTAGRKMKAKNTAVKK